MPLQFDVNMIASEDLHESLGGAHSSFKTACANRLRQRTVFTSGQANKAFGIGTQILFGYRCRSFWRTKLPFRKKTAEILVSRAIESKHGQRASGRHGDLRANMRPHSCFLSRLMKTCGAINTIAIEQCHGRHVEFMTGVNECFGKGSAIEKAECRCGVEFDVAQS